jgi:hypothetical protein
MWWFNKEAQMGLKYPKRMFCAGLLLSILSGCGYTLNHRVRPVFADKRGIFVPVFSNMTGEAGVERVFTNALIRELRTQKQTILSYREKGGLELLGEIISITHETNAFTEYGFGGLRSYRRIPSEYGVRVHVRLVLSDPKTKNVLWQSGFTGYRRVNVDISRTYDYLSPSATADSTLALINTTYGDIARDIMRDVYDEMVELF